MALRSGRLGGSTRPSRAERPSISVTPLDFATVAAYEESYFPWEGGGLLGREVHAMPTFVTLAKWTDEGIRTIKDSPKRRQAFEDRITSMGGKVKDAYLVMG